MSASPYYVMPNPKPKRKGGLMILIGTVALVLGLVFGTVIGTTSGKSTATLTAAAPTPTVTVTADAASSGPSASCLRALDEADEIIAIFGETMTIVAAAFGAAADFDSAELSRQADKIGDQTAKITASEYPTYANLCRAE